MLVLAFFGSGLHQAESLPKCWKDLVVGFAGIHRTNLNLRWGRWLSIYPVFYRVNFWKFGFQGDTKQSKNQKLHEIANNKMRHANKNSPAKVRLQYLINKAKEQGQSHIIEHLSTDWYGQMQHLSLVESKKLYLDQIGR
jgi:hypothetical protein